MLFPYYIYLHENGTLIEKSAFVCETNTTPGEYFDSPFVIKYWKIQSEDQLKEVIEFQENYNKTKK